MYKGNRGYVGQSMSVRAKKAYQKGLLSFSKIQAKHLKEKGLDISLSFFRWLVENGHIKPTEWHHTGKYYNRTNFFSLDDIRKQANRLDLTSLRNDYAEERAEVVQQQGYYAKVQCEEWSGGRKNGGHITFFTYAYVYKGWVHFSANCKKKLDGVRIHVVEAYLQKPEEMEIETRNGIFEKLKKQYV